MEHFDMTGKLVLTGNESINSGYSTINIEQPVSYQVVYICSMPLPMNKYRVSEY